jgi:hypothetical protein
MTVANPAARVAAFEGVHPDSDSVQTGGLVMKRILRVIGVVVLALSVVGCSQPSGNRPDSEPAVDAAANIEEATVVERAITLGYYGRMDEAVALLLEGSSPTAAEEPSLTCLGLSESEIIRAGEAAMAENSKAGDAARALARAAMAKVAEARAQGDEAKAAAYTERVKAMGTELAQDNHNKLVQMIGQAIEKKAAKAGS